MNEQNKDELELCGDASSRPRALTPRVDIIEGPQRFIIEAELPGVAEGDVELSVERGVLSLRAQSALKHVYVRSFRLGEDIDGEAVSARLSEGLLSIELPKTDRSRARRIAIS
jgi:HSP20 family protein